MQKVQGRNDTARILVLAFVLPLSAWGQGSGTITGVVRDALQSVVPGTSVHITNQQSGVHTTAVTNETGTYRANSILPGIYKIEVNAPGFSPLVRDGISLSTGQTLAIDLTVEV